MAHSAFRRGPTNLAGERGYVLVATTVFATVLLAFVGLAIDVGYLQWEKTHAQMAADAAAAGAGLQLLDGNGTSNIIGEGQYDASLNGFTQGVSNTTVTVNYPPTEGSEAGNMNAVEVFVQRTVPTFFMTLIGSPTASLTAHAVTVLGNNGGAGCVFVMDPVASASFSMSGSATSYLSCGLEVASSSASALSMANSATLYLKNNAIAGVVGGWSIGGSAQILNFTTGAAESPQQISAPADPLNYVNEPSTSGLAVQSMTKVTYTSTNPPPGNTIQPGVYCGGLAVTSGGPFTMAAGVYYIAGGGFSMSGSASVTGSGVTIYSTSGAKSGVSGCSTAFGAFSISTSGSVNLSAPTSGALEGILIFQDRSINSGTASTLSGSSNTVLNGAIYLLHSPLTFTGNSSSSQYLVLVTDKLTISGSSTTTVNANYSSLQDGSPIRNAAILAE
jgi:hypothetical protein